MKDEEKNDVEDDEWDGCCVTCGELLDDYGKCPFCDYPETDQSREDDA